MSASTSVVPAWQVLRLGASDADALFAWRLEPGLEVCARSDGGWWVRQRWAIGETPRSLDGLPATERFVCGTDGILRHPGGEIPRGQLPLVGWRSVAEACPVAAPPLVAPSVATAGRAALRLTRGGAGSPPVALLLPLSAWIDYAVEAPLVRLERWRYAASRAEGAALVLGNPLPPLGGERFVEPAARVLVPAGFGWTPEIDAAAVREVAGAAGTDYVWWREREGLAVLPEALFVPASRSGIRRLRESRS
ncbi:MAG: hypothetical protein JSR82_09280 [Verrucomicrobia bacterium]|nr:hypothetical protein [Verrucomicrobiota bacterium]